jgi:signal transduction histidine kinase
MRLGVRGPIDPQYIDDAKIIEDSGTHLLEVINNILDFAKADANSLQLYDDNVDVTACIALCVDLMADMGKNGDVACSVAVDEELPIFRGDNGKLRQILLNLLSNAIKFTPPGGNVTLQAVREADGGLALRVADTGIGIAPDKIAVAIEPFGQIDSRLARKYEGVGLGLPLSKKLVEMHGGTLEIDSVLGEGTAVTVRLPAERFALAAALEPAE